MKDERESLGTGLSQEEEKELKKAKRSELFQGIVILYFVICVFVTFIATEKDVFTYGQISMIYLPILFLFCFWQYRRYKNPETENPPSKERAYVSIGACAVMIVLTLAYNIAHWIG